ncbi:alkaline phosphatase family protein [Sphingomonas jaspsi]|uniref:alkaline phosphatase family protein n=1 Tax=Sphingomonas jaspsi TaxID=392409 RepID=UPI0004B8C619|nr:alkaline phosphatase family protein [Sphingomonas jaspsi]
MTRWGLLAACALIAAPTTAKAPERPAPKLIVAISVDQFSADLFDEYRPTFTGGLKRIAGGTAFRNGFQAHAATETCPGHSTILTGSFPARTGIIANDWTDQRVARSDKTVYCAEDERVPGSSSSAYTVSPVHLRVETLGEYLTAQRAGSRSVAVAGKDRAAVMMSGHKVDQRWYWDGKKYSTDQQGKAPPKAVTAINNAVAAMIAAPALPLTPPPGCEAKSKVYAVEGGGKAVGNGRFARAAGDARAFRASPAFDGATLALAAGLIGEMGLGKGSQPDLIAIGASATDYVGHTFGTEGEEMCLQMASLDRDLGDFLSYLDAQKIDYAVVLTADHGGNDIPERQRERGIPTAARIDPNFTVTAIGKQIGQKFGLAGPVLWGGSVGDVWLDAAIAPAMRPKVLAAAVAIAKAHPQVAEVFTRSQIERTAVPTGSPVGWTPIQRVRASFDKERSGDFVVVLKPRITPIADTKTYVATHGSLWDYDRRVPILFWRPGMSATQRNDATETVDIMPTLAAMLGLKVDRKVIDGHCLTIEGVACPAD